LKEALVAAAVDIIEKHGVEALTLRAVGRRVGVSQAAPYHHFEDKEALLAAVAEEGFVKLAEAMEDARAVAGSSPRARVRATGVGYVRFAVRHPSHFRVMFAGILPVKDHATLHAAGERAFGILVESVAAAQEAGVFRKGPVIELAALGWSMVHGLSMLYVNGILDGPGGPPGTIDHLAEAAAEAIVRGLEK
jgi:AcrR family transcriptional regulator